MVLELSEQIFIWMVRTPNDKVTDVAYSHTNGHNNTLDFLPDGFLERTKNHGLVVPTPRGADDCLATDEHINVDRGFNVALRDTFNENGIVDRFKIVRVATGLSEREEGKSIRIRIHELKEVAANVLSKDGAVVRLPDPKRKNLGIKDAIFDENRFSSIPRPKDIIPNVQESQLDNHTDDVPSEILEPRKVEGSRDQVRSQYSYCFSIEEDPITYNEVMQSRDAAFWKEAIDDEIGSIMENNTWVLSDLPPGCKPLEKLKPNTGKPIDQLEYSRAIGCLMYAMTSTRPDIAYVVGRLSRFTSNPSIQHWKAITRVFKWMGVLAWERCHFMGFQEVNMESEFMALTATGKEEEWLRNLIYEISIWPKLIAPISIRCDSVLTMAKAYSQSLRRKPLVVYAVKSCDETGKHGNDYAVTRGLGTLSFSQETRFRRLQQKTFRLDAETEIETIRSRHHQYLLDTEAQNVSTAVIWPTRVLPVFVDAVTPLHPNHHPVSIWDSEEVLVHQVVSMKKMNEKPGHVRPANDFYAKLNALMFVPQKDLSGDQAYWLSANEIASQASKSATPATPFVRKSRPPSQVLAVFRNVNAVFPNLKINIMKVLNVGSTESSCDQQALETNRIQLKDTITSLRIQLDGLKVENVRMYPTVQKYVHSKRAIGKQPVAKKKQTKLPLISQTYAKATLGNHRILPSKSVNARRAADHNRKLNVVDHNQFVIRSLKSVNTKTPQAKHSVNHTKKVWKATRNHNVNTTKTAWRPTRKVVGSVKPQWKPTG
ncbi:hypothetical protein Tco_0067406 [Tanacetum coccineum]